VLEVPGWPGHLPGQHVDVRLTAPDGYTAQRSYSIASAAPLVAAATSQRPSAAQLVKAGSVVELTVQRIPDGEVSPYLTDVLATGDPLELRGPVGGWFVWPGTDPTPVQLIAGGSGIVPLMAMIRHRIATGSDVPMRLLYSVRTPDEVIYRQELDRLAAGAQGIDVIYTFTRAAPAGWTGYHRRIDAAMLAEVGWPPEAQPATFVCGPTQFVETAANVLLARGYPAARIKTERFGPTGGP
jgi:ferredoxin-NADP reductase